MHAPTKLAIWLQLSATLFVHSRQQQLGERQPGWWLHANRNMSAMLQIMGQQPLPTPLPAAVPTVEIAPNVHFPVVQLGCCTSNVSVSLPGWLDLLPEMAAIDTVSRTEE